MSDDTTLNRILDAEEVALARSRGDNWSLTDKVTLGMDLAALARSHEVLRAALVTTTTERDAAQRMAEQAFVDARVAVDHTRESAEARVGALEAALRAITGAIGPTAMYGAIDAARALLVGEPAVSAVPEGDAES